MKPDVILAEPARVLTQTQREHYFEHGFVGVESLVPTETLTALVEITEDFVNQSRAETVSGAVFDIGPGHSADHPVLRRLKKPDDQHALYWGFAMGLMEDVAADLVVSTVTFHHSLLHRKLVAENYTLQCVPHIPAVLSPNVNFAIVVSLL